MDILPDRCATYMEPCRGYSATDCSDTDNKWKLPIGGNDILGGGMAITDVNALAANANTWKCCSELGYFPGGFRPAKYDGGVFWLHILSRYNTLAPFYEMRTGMSIFPLRYLPMKDSTKTATSLTNTKPLLTKWCRDDLVADTELKQTDSPIRYGINVSSIPKPGSSASLGNSTPTPSAGYFIIDGRASGTNVKARVWLQISSSTSPMSSVSDAGNDIQILIFEDGSTIASVVPVGKGQFVSMFAEVPEDSAIDKLFINARFASVLDPSYWE